MLTHENKQKPHNFVNNHEIQKLKAMGLFFK